MRGFVAQLVECVEFITHVAPSYCHVLLSQLPLKTLLQGHSLNLGKKLDLTLTLGAKLKV